MWARRFLDAGHEVHEPLPPLGVKCAVRVICPSRARRWAFEYLPRPRRSGEWSLRLVGVVPTRRGERPSLPGSWRILPGTCVAVPGASPPAEGEGQAHGAGIQVFCLVGSKDRDSGSRGCFVVNLVAIVFGNAPPAGNPCRHPVSYGAGAEHRRSRQELLRRGRRLHEPSTEARRQRIRAMPLRGKAGC